MKEDLINKVKNILTELNSLSFEDTVEVINSIKKELHLYSPFKNEPIDCVLWVKSNLVEANKYNPNKVAPAEMQLLNRSIQVDGYTQPVVVSDEVVKFEVVDGFHRNKVGKENPEIRERIYNYLPITIVKRPDNLTESQKLAFKMASTIRHNRARGTHAVDLMVNIVGELVESGMSDDWISKNIGMDADELLRLKQISGIAALFKDVEFSKAWVVNDTDAKWYENYSS